MPTRYGTKRPKARPVTPGQKQTIWSGRKTSVSSQLLADVYSNYARNMHNKTTSTPEDTERCDFILNFMRVLAYETGMPLWKIVDMVMSLGLAEFEDKYGASINAVIRNRQKKLDLTKEILQWHNDSADELKKYMHTVTDMRMDEMSKLA